MKKKILLTVMYIISFIPMMFYQYGWGIGVSAIKGFINIINPVGILSIILFFLGVWDIIKNEKVNRIFTYVGTIGIVICEIYNLFTWNYPNTSIYNHVTNFLDMTFPAYYIGLIASILMVFFCFYFNKKEK